MRAVLLELGRRLEGAGAVTEPSDVFWLTESELTDAAAALDAGHAINSHDGDVVERKAVWTARRSVVPPMGLPPIEGPFTS